MYPIPAIYVHDTKETPYALWIVKGEKPLETRSRNVLGKFVGERILVIRTRSGHPAEVIGEASMINSRFYTNTELDAMRNLTLIPKGSKYDCTGKGKWCYWLANVTEYEKPVPLSEYEVLSRNMSYAIVTSKKSK
jgi:hypothetical protein